MSTVAIPIHSIQFVFRKLTFKEEFTVQVQPGENPARAVVAAALVEVPV